MIRIIPFFILTTTLQIELTTSQDLKTIFRTPTKRNYDDFEILERSNFDAKDESTPTTKTIDKPKSYANAQVLLRFGGGEEKRKCACGDNCQCRHPYPNFAPIPFCVCIPFCHPHQYYTPPNFKPFVPPSWPTPCSFPPPPPVATPTAKPSQPEIVVQDNSQNIQVNNVQNDNVVDEGPQIVQQNSEVTNNHPIILNTVRLPEEIVKAKVIKPEPDEQIQKCLKEVTKKICPTEVSPNIKIVTLDLCKVPKVPPKEDLCDLENSLVTYVHPKLSTNKLLVSYPIFNKLDDNIMPVRVPLSYSQSGYRYCSGGGYYSDPVKTVIYRKPSVLEIIGPQIEKGCKYVLVPVGTPSRPRDECCPCSCAKYVGELNEQVVL